MTMSSTRKGIHVRIDGNRCVPIALRQQLRRRLRIGVRHLHHLADIRLLLRRARSWHRGGRVSFGSTREDLRLPGWTARIEAVEEEQEVMRYERGELVVGMVECKE